VSSAEWYLDPRLQEMEWGCKPQDTLRGTRQEFMMMQAIDGLIRSIRSHSWPKNMRHKRGEFIRGIALRHVKQTLSRLPHSILRATRRCKKCPRYRNGKGNNTLDHSNHACSSTQQASIHAFSMYMEHNGASCKSQICQLSK